MATPELLSALSSLSRRVDALLESNNRLLERIKVLEESNVNLQHQHEEDLQTLQNAQKEIEFLKISHRLAASSEALVASRQKVEQLIKTIDNCIRLIKED